MSDRYQQELFRRFMARLKRVNPYINRAKAKGIREAMKLAARLAQNEVPPSFFASAVAAELGDRFFDSLSRKEVVDKLTTWAKADYLEYRKTPIKDIFPGKALVGYPALKNWRLPIRPHLALVDQRTMEFLAESDHVYLGKYIKAPDTQERMVRFLEQEYIQGGKALGRNPKAISAFRNRFVETVNLEDWKVRRIIDTSVSNTRNYAHVRSFQQCQVTEYEIAGPTDRLTCDHCADMVGRVFRVEKTVEKLDSLIAAGPQETPNLSPFLSGRLSPETQKGMSDEQLQEAGFDIPPYHCHCRHRIVAFSWSDTLFNDLLSEVNKA